MKKVLLFILALILVAWIICAGYFFIGQKNDNVDVKIEVDRKEAEIGASEINNTWWDWIYKEWKYTFRERRVQIWNISEYKNKEYGFQLLLPESWNDCIIDEYQTLANETANIDMQSFDLICPSTFLNSDEWHRYLNDDVKRYIPEWYYLIGSIIIGSENTAERVRMDEIPDEKAYINNKYKIRFELHSVETSITKQGKILFSDLECWKYPYCECEEQIKDYYDDNLPDSYQSPTCFVSNFIRDHLEVFDIEQ